LITLLFLVVSRKFRHLNYPYEQSFGSEEAYVFESFKTSFFAAEFAPTTAFQSLNEPVGINSFSQNFWIPILSEAGKFPLSSGSKVQGFMLLLSSASLRLAGGLIRHFVILRFVARHS
jgi:hypothetical protein